MNRKSTFAPVKQNDTASRKRILITKDGSPMDLTGATISMDFKANPNGRVLLEFSSNDTIEVDNPMAGEIFINKFQMTLPPATYFFNLHIQFPNGDSKTVLTGTWVVTNNIL